MDFLTDATKKERRSLLATGSVGIVVGWLKIFPTEIDLLGIKFQSPALPLTAIVVLCAVIGYFLVKFFLSYMYERSDREMQKIASQILEGKTAIDIARVEQEIRDLSQDISEKRNLAMKQLEHETNRLALAESQIRVNVDTVYESNMELIRQDEARIKGRLERLDAEAMRFGQAKYLESKNAILGDAADIQGRILEIQGRRETELAAKLKDFENDRTNSKQLHEATLRALDLRGEEVIAKTRFVGQWKQAHKTSQYVSPVYKFLEVAFPLLLGILAIGFLTWLGFHPPEPKPISLPNF